MKLPWKCPACGTVHTHPTAGCRHCGREVTDKQGDTDSRLGKQDKEERLDNSRADDISSKPKSSIIKGKRL
jgi:uncharacterized membrane protein YvbJ